MCVCMYIDPVVCASHSMPGGVAATPYFCFYFLDTTGVCAAKRRPGSTRTQQRLTPIHAPAEIHTQGPPATARSHPCCIIVVLFLCLTLLRATCIGRARSRCISAHLCSCACPQLYHHQHYHQHYHQTPRNTPMRASRLLGTLLRPGNWPQV